MQAVPIHIKEANAFIAKYHRHSLPTVGGKFAVGAVERGKLVGVAVAGRPVARPLHDGKTIEVLRVSTDGTPNCCSFLYARVAKIARLFGYTRVISYSLEEECGAILRAVGGRLMAGLKRGNGAPQTAPAKARLFTERTNCGGSFERPVASARLVNDVGRGRLEPLPGRIGQRWGATRAPLEVTVRMSKAGCSGLASPSGPRRFP